MERFTNIDQATQAQIDALRASEVAAASGGEDDYLTDRIDASGMPTEDPSGLLVDRRTREHVAYYQDESDAWHPTPLKRNDDILCDGGIPMRVVGPARTRGNIMCWCKWDDVGIDEAFIILLSMIVDRAPLDPNETPMPLIPEPAMRAMSARSAVPTNPKEAAKGERKDERPIRRAFKDAMRDAIAKLPHDQQKHAREVLRAKGVLGTNE
jgi:hypothetical protein